MTRAAAVGETRVGCEPALTRSFPWLFPRFFVAAILLGTVACASTGPKNGASVQGSSPGPGETPARRTLVIAVGGEPGSIATRTLVQSGGGRQFSTKIFNAQLGLLDDRAQPVPQLAASLPQLNSDSWRVFADGRMETTYRLRPNLAWHDGSPLTADDFVFAWRVFSHPEVGGAGTPPLAAMSEVLAPEPLTLMIRWSAPHPDAGALASRDREFPPLPRHILLNDLEEGGAATIANHAYWAREFVGAGPYRLERWDPGSFIEASAFQRYALGTPSVGRIKIMFANDSNAIVANVLAGEVQAVMEVGDLGREQLLTLRRDWEARGKGKVLRESREWGATHFQLRPEFVSPSALLDSRVRKALAHSLDKQALNDVLYEGEGTPATSMFSPLSAFGQAADVSAVKYPYDVQRSEQLMADAGHQRGLDGLFAGPSGERLSAELKTNAGPTSEAEVLIMANGWRQAGFAIQESVLPAALSRNAEVRATFPSMFTYTSTPGDLGMVEFVQRRIPTAENRWLGGNRAGWSDPRYEVLAASFNTTLDQNERQRQVTQMVAIFTEALPANSLFFRTSTVAYVAGLQGPTSVASESNVGWNVHTWVLQ
ncbi:MAG: hypothetical protein HW416_2328 [Chloroflexi bacterium]|nr:hypothetical protein [Chloroflexota bacterium]